MRSGVSAAAATKQALLTMLDSDRIEILEQPKDLAVSPRQKVVLTCRARVSDTCQDTTGSVGGEEPKLQWYRGEEAIAGETAVDLVFSCVEEKDFGLYYCLVTHPGEEGVKKCSDVAQISMKTSEFVTH